MVPYIYLTSNYYVKLVKPLFVEGGGIYTDKSGDTIILISKEIVFNGTSMFIFDFYSKKEYWVVRKPDPLYYFLQKTQGLTLENVNYILNNLV